MTETPPHCLCLVWRTLAVQLLCLQSSEEEAGSTAGRYMMARPWEALAWVQSLSVRLRNGNNACCIGQWGFG